MTTDLPAYILDLVCCLEENSTDDEFIISTVLNVMSSKSKAYRLMSYLQKKNRTEAGILQVLQKL